MTTNEEGLTLTEATEFLLHIRQHNPHQAVFIWGPVGVGKSQIVRQISESLEIGLQDMRLSQMDPPDLRGIPYREGTQTKYAAPAELPADGEGILFLDEANAASRATFAAALQLVLDRQLGEYKVPDGWSIWSAGNRLSDKSVANAIPAALANRYIHVTVKPDKDTLVRYGLGEGWDPMLLQFFNFRPELIHQMPAGREIEAFPSPRAWEMVHRSKALDAPHSLRRDLIRGAVGVGAMLELENFLELIPSLPSLDEIMLSPATARLPDTVSTKHALVGALSKVADHNCLAKILSYLERWKSREWETAFMATIAAQKPDLLQTNAAIAWNINNQDLRAA